MRLIDVQFLDTPFFGVRQMTWYLRNEGQKVNEKRVRLLMRLMGLMPIYQKPNTSRPTKGHRTYLIWLARSACGPARSGLVCGHHLSADASPVPLPSGDDGLAYPDGLSVEHLQHAGRRLLR